MSFFERIFADANQRLENLVQENCQCSVQPVHYNNIHLEYVPNYIEIRDNLAWDHSNDNDPAKGTVWVNSFDKPYLNYINTLAQQTPGYEDGFNVIITTDGPFFNEYVYNNPENKPLWELGYDDGQYNGVAYSAFPTYDLSHPAMWHYPDMYLIYINGYDHLGGEWWLETSEIPHNAGGFLHEYGHYFNLSHVSCSQNIMKPSSNIDRSFSGCQVREMYQTLMTKNLRKYVICEDKLDFDIEVNTDETWRINTRIFGDIVVKNGATLTITCEVHMSPKGRIRVERGGELIVDGGLITGDCTDNWKGIVVEGDVPGHQALSGKVVLKNSAIIEHARDAISMNPDHLPWDDGDQQNFYGGLVEAENSTIRDCVRGVEFMKYGRGGIKDQSWFHHVNFENLQHEGVTIWANDGVTFDHCTFSKITKKGILAYDCEVIVREDNTFEEQPIGVDVITTYPIIFSPKIGVKGFDGNTFLCQDAGVNIQSGGNVEPLNIFNNVFTGGNNGIRQNGNSLLHVENNSLSGHLTSVELYDGGTQFSHVNSNEIQSSFLGAHSVLPNSGLRYLDNCFSSNQLVDIFVSDGDIFPWQGNPTLAAGNCFTKNGIPEVDNDAGTGNVTYFVKTGTPNSSCKFPVNLNNVALVTNADNENATDCGPQLTDEGEEYYCDFNEDLPIAQLRQQRVIMLQDLASYGSDNESLAAKTLERCIETLESIIGQKMLDPASEDPHAGKEFAISFYNSAFMDFKDKTSAYGIMVHYGELARANAFLNTLNTQTQDQSDFVVVQQINLAYLAHPADYELSEVDRNYLYTVGTSDGAFNGYARALYEVLTGERIKVEIPEVDSQERNNTGTTMATTPLISVYPNPSGNGVFNLQIGHLSQNTTYNVMVNDATGRLRHTASISKEGTYSLGNEQMPSGLYFLTIRDDSNHTLFQSKLIVL
ncbi:MAG: T9SS type A sorting domain-containing protein [Saprospiraceae bacterium]|nr:T9SS type A sorting domain-containing protein [Saprospiraceae bacterium]